MTLMNNPKGKLIILRHGQSIWNLKNRFTGIKDVPLTDRGRNEARVAGHYFKETGLKFDLVFSSYLCRANETAELALVSSSPLNDHLRGESGQWMIIKDEALNERDYGDLTGLDKEETAEKFGADQVKRWRRGYDTAPPNGESLADVVERVGKYFDSKIRPYLVDGKTVLIASHENALRGLLVHVGENTRENIVARDLKTGEPVLIKWV